MTIYDDMRGYVHVHDRNGWFDVTTETTPMYQMIDKADAENAKLRDMCSELYRRYWDVEGDLFIDPEMGELEEKLRKLGIETWEAWE